MGKHSAEREPGGLKNVGDATATNPLIDFLKHDLDELNAGAQEGPGLDRWLQALRETGEHYADRHPGHAEDALYRWEIWHRTNSFVDGTNEWEWRISAQGWTAVDFTDAKECAHAILCDFFFWEQIPADCKQDYSIRVGPAHGTEWEAGFIG